MNLWLAFNIVLVVGLVIALAWAYDARRLAHRACRVLVYQDQPTEEIELPATMKIGPKLQAFDPWPPERR